MELSADKTGKMLSIINHIFFSGSRSSWKVEIHLIFVAHVFPLPDDQKLLQRSGSTKGKQQFVCLAADVALKGLPSERCRLKRTLRRHILNITLIRRRALVFLSRWTINLFMASRQTCQLPLLDHAIVMWSVHTDSRSAWLWFHQFFHSFQLFRISIGNCFIQELNLCSWLHKSMQNLPLLHLEWLKNVCETNLKSSEFQG